MLFRKSKKEDEVVEDMDLLPDFHPNYMVRFELHKPTVRDFTLELVKLSVERSKLPWWRLYKRSQLTLDIENVIFNAQFWLGENGHDL